MSQNTNTASALPRDATQIKEIQQPGLKSEKIALIITTSVENLKVITLLLFIGSVNVLFSNYDYRCWYTLKKTTCAIENNGMVID